MHNEFDAKLKTADSRFHSRYNPAREAERFVQACIGSKRPGIVIVLGPGENYIHEAIKNILPQTSIYSVQPSSVFLTDGAGDGSVWTPDSPGTLRQFLRTALINERAAAGVAVLEWEPVMAAFPEESSRIRNELTRCLATSAADRATVSYWARKWLRNSLNFSLNIKTSALLGRQESAILLAAAGPGLTESIASIKKLKSRASTWALASAVPALRHAGIEPDLILATDPGFWNGVHLRYALDLDIPYAIPPSVCAPWSSFRPGTQIVPLNTGLLFEEMVLRKTGSHWTSAHAFGTAAGTALSLALGTTTGPVLLFGLDFAAEGIVSHAKPYAFDILPALRETRLASRHSVNYGEVIERYPERNGDWRFSRAFSAYAQEISIQEKDRPRVVRITRSPIETGGLPGQDISILDDLPLPGRKPLATIGTRKSVGAEAEGCPEQTLRDLLAMASHDIENSLSRKKCTSFDTTLALKALCPKESATLLAKLARGEAEPNDAQTTMEALERNVAAWIRDFS